MIAKSVSDPKIEDENMFMGYDVWKIVTGNVIQKKAGYRTRHDSVLPILECKQKAIANVKQQKM